MSSILPYMLFSLAVGVTLFSICRSEAGSLLLTTVIAGVFTVKIQGMQQDGD